MTFEEVLPALKAGKKPSGPLVGAEVKNISLWLKMIL